MRILVVLFIILVVIFVWYCPSTESLSAKHVSQEAQQCIMDCIKSSCPGHTGKCIAVCKQQCLFTINAEQK